MSGVGGIEVMRRICFCGAALGLHKQNPRASRIVQLFKDGTKLGVCKEPLERHNAFPDRELEGTQGPMCPQGIPTLTACHIVEPSRASSK